MHCMQLYQLKFWKGRNLESHYWFYIWDSYFQTKPKLHLTFLACVQYHTQQFHLKFELDGKCESNLESHLYNSHFQSIWKFIWRCWLVLTSNWRKQVWRYYHLHTAALNRMIFNFHTIISESNYYNFFNSYFYYKTGATCDVAVLCSPDNAKASYEIRDGL